MRIGHIQPESSWPWPFDSFLSGDHGIWFVIQPCSRSVPVGWRILSPYRIKYVAFRRPKPRCKGEYGALSLRVELPNEVWTGTSGEKTRDLDYAITGVSFDSLKKTHNEPFEHLKKFLRSLVVWSALALIKSEGVLAGGKKYFSFLSR